VDKLIEESRRRLKIDPFEANELAECAHDVALRIPVGDFGADWAMTCVARSNAHRGNALRVIGNFRGAEQLLEAAVRLLADQGSTDPLVEAEVLGLVSTLRREQGRFEEARANLDLALSLSSACGAEDRVGSLLVKMAIVLSEEGEFETAMRTVEEAMAYIDPAKDPQLYLAAQHELTLYLQQAGRAEEARARLADNLPLYQQFPDPWTQSRLQLLAGKVARDLGQSEEAERALVSVREQYVARGLGLDAAFAGLDLSLVYLAEGKTKRVRDLAAELVPSFLAQGIDREATAALLLLREAVRREA
jgi:tetratricopeptide (TPR) repeat protein